MIKSITVLSYEAVRQYLEEYTDMGIGTVNQPCSLDWYMKYPAMLPQDKVFVSITDPHRKNTMFVNDAWNVCTIRCWDADPRNDDPTAGTIRNNEQITREQAEGVEHPWFTDDDAKKILEYMDKWNSDPRELDLILHCMGGICRSGAVGLNVCERIHFDQNKFMARNPQIRPNQYILEIMRNASC